MFGTLSDSQREIVFEKAGKVVIRACPGSGKTFSVSARLARLIKGWGKKHQGIATISFTNTAWQEIQKKVETHFGISNGVQYPHFLGTIDSFINQYIFLPFGHLVIGCTGRPELVGEPFGSWHGRFFYDKLFDKIHYTIDGEIVPSGIIRIRGGLEASKSKIQWSKNNLHKAGFSNQRDANYFAMKVLEDCPAIAKALVYRFPFLIMDEAQDSADIQMKILDILLENGLEEVMLVGDPDQAIFEWNNARPDLFVQKHEEWEDNSVILNENRRSSQKICNATHNLSSLDEVSNAANDAVKDFDFVPEVITYNPDNLMATVEYFIDLCKDNGIEVNEENIAVISRSKKLLNKVDGVEALANDPWKDDDYHTKDLARGKYLFERGDINKGFSLIERAYLRKLKGKNVCMQEDIRQRIEEVGFVEHRKEIYKILTILPSTDCNIRDWIKKANDNFNSNDLDIFLSIKSTAADAPFDQLFRDGKVASQTREYRLGTVHSVKGETLEATLLFLGKKGKGAYYKTMLRDNICISDNEELRIVYVGMTRPRKLLVLAVPDEENKQAWITKLSLE